MPFHTLNYGAKRRLNHNILQIFTKIIAKFKKRLNINFVSVIINLHRINKSEKV